MLKNLARRIVGAVGRRLARGEAERTVCVPLPGDDEIVILRSPHKVSMEQARRLKVAIGGAIQRGAKVVLVEDGLDLEVSKIRKPQPRPAVQAEFSAIFGDA